jgi:hypothetical protein
MPLEIHFVNDSNSCNELMAGAHLVHVKVFSKIGLNAISTFTAQVTAFKS